MAQDLDKNDLPWERFWCKSTGTYSLADDGYLYVPESGSFFHSTVQSLNALESTPCLVLLGEPGIGKTRVVAKYAESQEQAQYIDLRSFGSEDRLLRRLTESPEVTAWKNGEGTLTLYLDSLDECLLQIRTVADVILAALGELKNYISRLRLRIGCRTAEWPSYLEKGLEGFWKKSEIETYELAPLRRSDVELAAKAYSIAPDKFIDALGEASAQPLANRPVTLRFLLQSYAASQTLPRTRNELYEHGCRVLCEESSTTRREKSHSGQLDPAQRLVVAARIAAVMTYCNRANILQDTGVDPSEEDIRIADLAGGREHIRGVEIEVTEKNLREALGTALFNSRGPGRLGWAHNTYREYLAAAYLVWHNVSIEQLKLLFLHGETNQWVVPQLQETAGWLAGMRPDFVTEVCKSDPEVLLRSDSAMLDASTRASIVSSLLSLMDRFELADSDINFRSSYGKLSHPGLTCPHFPYHLL